MQHFLTPYSTIIQPYVWWENTFNESELNFLQEKASKSNETALVGSPSQVSKEQLQQIRRSQVSWVNKTQETAWVFEKLAHVVSSVNSKYYGFDLTGFGEPLQLTNYDQSDHGMYGWHQDYNANVSRKLSLVLQLTDPSEYEGGNLQIMTGGEPQNVRKQRGLLALFPSYVLHQVTPVTKGSRQSLVAWISGPNFK